MLAGPTLSGSLLLPWISECGQSHTGWAKVREVKWEAQNLQGQALLSLPEVGGGGKTAGRFSAQMGI